MNRLRLVVVMSTVALSLGNADASRRFAENGRLKYDTGGASVVDGLESFGLSLWIKLGDEADPLAVREIVHNANSLDENGFRLTLHEQAGELRFAYHGALADGGDGEIIASVPLGELPPDTWFHVAADLDLASAAATIYLNGSTNGTISLPIGGFAPMDGNSRLFVGDRANTAAPGLAGDVHDVCIADHVWTGPEIALLQTASARDVTTGIVLNPRLRATAADTEFSGLVPVETGTLMRGMGPPITYADQDPTVVVIGDTQNLDRWINGTDPSEAVEMRRIGRFIHDYRDSLRIAAVFHVGDWVDSGRPQGQMVMRARSLVDEFRHEGIPWACTIGNHDYQDVATRNVDYWASDTDWTMPARLFEEESWHVAKLSDSVFELPVQDRDYAHAFRFDLDGQVQLGISLPNAPTVEMLDWARDIAADHSDKPVWIVTHQYLAGNGGLPVAWNSQSSGTPGLAGGPRAVLFEYFEHIPNLAFVFNGHVGAIANRRCDNNQSGDGQGGVFMPAFRSMVVNAQHVDFGMGEPGDHNEDGSGFMQLLSINTVSGHVGVESYISLYDVFHEPDSSLFNFELQLDELCEINDCNENLYHDNEETTTWGITEDCDQNSMPDECQPDLICELDLSEIRIGPAMPGNPFEYVEIATPVGTPLDAVQYIVLGDAGDDGDSGRVELSVRLSGQMTNESGRAVIAGPDFELGTADFVADLQYDPYDNTTHLLVRAGANIWLGTDLDTDDDGVLDVIPWSRIWGEVGFVYEENGGEHLYTDNRYGPDEAMQAAPLHLLECEGTYASCPPWRIGEDDPASGLDSPGAANPSCDCCDPDINGDATVDFFDLVAVLSQWGEMCVDCPEDIDGSGQIDFEDVLSLVASWGTVPLTSAAS